MQRFAILAAILYITFIGGTAYTANNLVLRIFFHVVVTAVVLLWLVRRDWPRTPFDLPLLVYALILGLTTASSQNWRISLEQSWPFWMHVVWYYLLIDVMQRGRQRWVFEALFMAGGVLIIVSIVEILSWYFGTGFAGLEQGWFPIGGVSIPPELHKLSLALNVSTIVGNYAALLLPVVFAWGLTARQPDHRLGLHLLGLGILWVLVGSGSRGSLVALAGAISVMGSFWLIRRRLFPRKFILTGLVAVIFLLGAMVMFFAFRSSSTSDQRRVDMWESALRMVEDDPMTGVGVYQFGAEYRLVRDKTLIQDKIVAAHNLWLNTLAEIGLPGLMVVFWLGGIFLVLWWRTWSDEGTGRQIRLEGILAALVGFCLHSLIDTFTLSASVLPILIFSAYVVAGHHTPFRRGETTDRSRLWSYGVAVFVIGFFAWLIRVDVAGLRYMNGLVQIGKEEYTQSRDYLDGAQSLDPDFGLYLLQDAYVLGLMAEDDPEKYLDAAVAAHVDTLKDNPTFDTGFANLAALYAQKNDYASAVESMQQALAIRPDLWQYWLLLADYQESAGQPDAAIQSYVEALDKRIEITRSEYWNALTPTREAALELAYATLSPAQRTLLAVNLDWPERAEKAVADIEPESYLDYLALAHYALYREDHAAALQWYTEAIENNVGNLPVLYAERAEISLSMGQREDAEKDARTAIFLNPIDGARAYYVLAQLSGEDEKTINQYLIRAVVPEISVQEYASAVYARPARLNYLPQLKVPGQGRTAYEPWFWLAERYASDDDEETDPADVYEAIQASEPYLKLD